MTNKAFLLLGGFLALQAYAVHGYGTYGSSSSRTTEAPTTPPPRYESEHGQWGGVGPNNPNDYTANNQRGSSNDRNSGNRYPGGSSQWGKEEGNGQSNNFARETHVERYGVPETCVHEADPEHVCNYFVEIKKERDYPESLHFEISRHVDEVGGWVGMGFSKDKFMGEDLMVECVLLEDGTARLYHSWARSKSQQPSRLTDDPSLIQRDETYPRYENGVLTCKFRMKVHSYIDIEGKQMEFDLERGKYYVLMAAGKLRFPKSDSIGYHGDQPIAKGFAYVSPKHFGYINERYPARPRQQDHHDNPSQWNGGNREQTFSLKVGTVIFTLSFLLRTLFT